MKLHILFASACISAALVYAADTSAVGEFDAVTVAKRQALDRALDTQVDGWRCAQGDISGAESVDFDDSGWEIVDVGHKWWPHDSICWFRKVIEIPARIAGADVTGARVRLKLGMDNEAEVFVDGRLAGRFAWWEGDITLAEQAQPGQHVVVAIRGINHPGYGQFLRADLVCDRSEPLVESLKEFARYLDLVAAYIQPGEDDWIETYSQAVQALDLEAFERAETERVSSSIQRARLILLERARETTLILDRLKDRVESLKQNLRQAEQHGLQAPYVRQKTRVVESFIDYSRDDLATGDLWKSIRAARNTIFIEDLARRAEVDIKHVLSTKKSEADIAFYRTGPSPIHEGVFTQHGRPIFFNGVGHFSQVRRDIPILNDYGFNMIQIEIGPHDVVFDNGKISPDRLEREVIEYLDKAADYDVAVNLLISPHYFPRWAIDRYPELAECGHGFLRYCVEHPVSRSIMERYLRAIMPRLKDHPALHSICLTNEPQYRDGCERSRRLFQEWLARRYPSIQDVNELCGTTFRSFDGVPVPAQSGFSPLLYLWCLFNQDRFLAWHKWIADIIHEYDPDLRVHAKVMAKAFDGPGEFLNGIDHERFAQLGAISGNDCWCQVPRKEIEPFEYAQQWINQAMYYDFQRSAAPGQPIVNSENHLIRDDAPMPVSGAHMYTAIWQGAMHGMGGHAIWVWERSEGRTTSDNILTRAPCVEAAGRVGLDLLRCGEQVAGFVRQPAQVALLYSWASTAADAEHVEEVKKVYEGLYFCGVPVRFVTERQCADGLLSKYRLVIVPKANRVKPGTIDALVSYARPGGRVVIVAPSLERDEFGKAQEGLGTLRETDGVTIIQLPMTARAYREVLWVLLDEMEILPPVLVKGRHGEPVWGVRWECVKTEDGLLVNLVNLGRESRWVRLVGSREKESWYDLLSRTPVYGEILLEPLVPRLLKPST